MKRMLILFIGLFLLTGAVGTAIAGPENRCRWERVIIGAGTLLLLNEILDHPQSECRFRENACRRGRWKIRRRWVPPVYKHVWREGYYDGRCRWIRGHWARIKIRNGHYGNQRVWVDCP